MGQPLLLSHFRLPQEKLIPLPGGISPEDITVDQIRVRSVLKIVVGIFDLLLCLGDLPDKGAAIFAEKSFVYVCIPILFSLE